MHGFFKICFPFYHSSHFVSRPANYLPYVIHLSLFVCIGQNPKLSIQLSQLLKQNIALFFSFYTHFHIVPRIRFLFRGTEGNMNQACEIQTQIGLLFTEVGYTQREILQRRQRHTLLLPTKHPMRVTRATIQFKWQPPKFSLDEFLNFQKIVL